MAGLRQSTLIYGNGTENMVFSKQLTACFLAAPIMQPSALQEAYTQARCEATLQ
jgi:hypothetical protein